MGSAAPASNRGGTAVRMGEYDHKVPSKGPSYKLCFGRTKGGFTADVLDRPVNIMLSSFGS